jgi:hypothetical protein
MTTLRVLRAKRALSAAWTSLDTGTRLLQERASYQKIVST